MSLKFDSFFLFLYMAVDNILNLGEASYSPICLISGDSRTGMNE